MPGRANASVQIVCGHWAALGLMLRPDVLALDSGCVWKRALTAVRLEDRRVVQQDYADD
jgi:bis(5'-nucleosyl)-tetraphosphatase (symmetrical)